MMVVLIDFLLFIFWSQLIVFVVIGYVVLIFGVIQKFFGWFWCGLGFVVLVLILVNFLLVEEECDLLVDVVILVIDISLFMDIGGCFEVVNVMVEVLCQKVENDFLLDFVEVEVDEGVDGIEVFVVVSLVFVSVFQDWLVGIVVIIDGQIYDVLVFVDVFNIDVFLY